MSSLTMREFYLTVLCHSESRNAALGSDLHIPLLEAEQVLTARQEELQSHSSTQVRDNLKVFDKI